VPREYFAAFHDAIEHAEIHDNVVISVLPEVQYPDMVAEVADFLLRLDEVEWACAIGRYKDFLHVSLRTTEREANAGDVLQQVLGSRWAGGHDMIAGGRMRLDGNGAAAVTAAADGVRARLLQTLGNPAAPGRPLVE
jgi:nanoRNase/pAp phosphatase (c-di-AMP/oligoRNAs hydrolase)